MEKYHPIPIRVLSERMAGYHYSVASTSEVVPVSAVLTYPVKLRDAINYNFLLKLIPCLFIDGITVYPSSYRDIIVEDFPGGVEASFSYEGIRIQSRITPLIIGREAKNWNGAVLYEVQCTPATDMVVYFGTGEFVTFHPDFKCVLHSDKPVPIDNSVFLDETSIRFHGGKEKLNIIVKSSDVIKLENRTDPGSSSGNMQTASVTMTGGSGYILTGFSDNEDELESLVKLDILAEKNQVASYYAHLLQTNLETPEPVMNQAFQTALYNLEYSWFEPFGWGECLQHWLALWHMQVGATADLIGQTARSRTCILEHAYKLFDSGAVPQFMPNKMLKRDFGGSNHYWVWQIRHYVNCTGDKEFAREILPYLDRVINQTLEEHDSDGDNLVDWGLQIGNQEDFVANPYTGSVPSIELYNMFMTRSELSRLLNENEIAEQWHKKADSVKNNLYKELWLKDLGRFAYYKDPTGLRMLDGQYQTYLYPIIYEMVDLYDQYSGLRHLRDRLTGGDGAVYLSNNFSWHAYGTWGMQCGLAQQPWAAAGFSKAGLSNETWKPLKVMAEWAQDINHRGAWPEVGPESWPSYFTPPAGLYIVSIIEDLFGIHAKALDGYLEIAPSFPDHWHSARLNTPDFQVSYVRQGNKLEYEFRTTTNLPVKINWRLPVSVIKSCTLNNKAVNYTINPGVNHILLSFEAEYSPATTICIEYEPVTCSVNVPASAAEGQKLAVSVEGITIERIIDRCGVLNDIIVREGHSISADVKNGLLDSYRSYNQLGLLNFSRRTFFVDCKTIEGTPFIIPVDMTILPRFEAVFVNGLKKTSTGYETKLLLRNNTDTACKDNAMLSVGGFDISTPVDVAPRSEKLHTIKLPKEIKLSSGDNDAKLSITGEAQISIHFTSDEFDNTPEFTMLDLPEKDMIPDTSWNTIRWMPGFPHIFFTFTNYGWPVPMYSYQNGKEISVDQIPGLKFRIPNQKFIPVSNLSGKVSYKLDLGDKIYKKLYLLLLPFVDNHNMFAPVARVSAYTNNRDEAYYQHAVYSRTLYYPGDLDYWVPNKNPTSFATLREPRPERFALLPLLTPDMKDWSEGKPPAFPQPKWWASSLPVVAESCVMSIVEINLSKPMKLDHLLVEAIGAMPAFGIVALTGEII